MTNKIAFIIVCATIVFTTVAYGAVHQPVIAVFYLMVAALLILWAAGGLAGGHISYSRSYLQLPLIAVVVYGLFQVIPFGTIAKVAGVDAIPRTISLDPFATLVSTLHFLALFIFFAVLLSLLDSASRLRNLVITITVFGFIYAFYAILQSVLSPDKIYGIYESRYALPFGSFVNRNNFAAYMEMTMSLPLGLLFTGAVSKDKRLLYITAIGLMGVALVLSSSRGGLIAFLSQIILLVLLTTAAKKGGNILLKAGFTVLLVGLIIAGSIFVGGDNSLARFAETASSGDVTTNRSHIWNVSLDVIRENMPLGAGLGAFGVAYTQHDPNSGFERVEQAHNDYLQTAADAGIVGLILGGFFIFWLFRNGLKAGTGNLYRRGIAVGALTGCFAVLVHSIFDFVLHTTAISVLFLTLAAILVASRTRYDDDIQEFEIRKTKRKRSSENVKPLARTRRSLESRFLKN